MVEEIRIFGAALDALSSLERVNLKRAYLHHLRNESSKEECKDPYDFIKTHMVKKSVPDKKIKWSGKIPIPSWLTPKPNKSDSPRVSVDSLGQFLESDGCWQYARMIGDYILRKIYPAMPVMIGVDHSLTGGSIMAMAERYPNLNVVILDAHFDVMNTDSGDEPGRRREKAAFSSFDGRKMRYESQLNYYGCGNFLDHLLKRKVIVPENLWIIGVQDEICREMKGRKDSGEKLDRNTISVRKWMRAGVHVIFKHEVRSGRFKIDLNGPTYLSIDMDVGSLSSVYSARFMNSYGLNQAEFVQLLHKVSGFIRSSHCPLVGLDVMEVDVHFFGAVREKKMDDRTEEIVKEIFKLFIKQNGCKDAS